MTTSSSATLLLAFFNNYSDAENAVRDLQAAGFRSDQIGTSYEDYDVESNVNHRDLTSGSTSGTGEHRSFWQKIEDFFSSEDHGRERETSAGNKNNEWSATGLSIPDHYRDRWTAGGEMVGVRATDRRTEAEQILTRNNGQIDNDSAMFTEHPATAPGIGMGTRADVTGGSTTPGIQVAEAGETTTMGQAHGALGDLDERRIQLISEVLRVRKERVSRGEVRLRKEVRTETQNVQVPVTREEIVIERNPVEGERTATGKIGSESEIRVPLSEERVEVEKVPVVTEEVRVAKRPISETQTVRDQVRREELEVEGADENLRDDFNERKTA